MSLSIRLPEDLERRLRALAASTGRTKAFYIRQAIAEHLDNLEDYYLAERELEAVRSGRSTTIPLVELVKRHGLED